MLEDSILTSTKKMLSIDVDYNVFDLDIIMHINAVLAKLNQLGIGPAEGFYVEDASSTWTEFIGTDPKYSAVKTFVYMSVRMFFDPPEGRFALVAIKEEIAELQWRLSVLRESTATQLLSNIQRVVGNTGDEHNIRIENPVGQTFINSMGTYEATFVSRDNSVKRTVKLDTSQISSGVLILPATIEDGVYTVRSLSPRNTIMVIEVSAQ